jgi:hypothetical protein
MEKKKNTQGGNDEHGRRKGEIWPNPSKIWTTCNFLGRPLNSSLGWSITKQGETHSKLDSKEFIQKLG